MKIIYLIICVLLLMACGDRPKQQPSNTENDRVEELYDRAKADSVCQEILRKAKDEVELEKKSSPKSVTKKLVLNHLRQGDIKAKSRNMTICGALILRLRMIWMIMA